MSNNCLLGKQKHSLFEMPLLLQILFIEVEFHSDNKAVTIADCILFALMFLGFLSLLNALPFILK